MEERKLAFSSDESKEFQQMRLFPDLDRTETRRNLTKVFGLYRRCKVLLQMGELPEVIRVVRPAKVGYEGAADPDSIRSPSLTWQIPVGNEDKQVVWMRRFCQDVEYRVNRLPSTAKREIVKRRFMTLEEPLPSDTEVWLSLRKDGMAMGERTYDRLKQEALALLAASLGVQVPENM